MKRSSFVSIYLLPRSFVRSEFLPQNTSIANLSRCDIRIGFTALLGARCFCGTCARWGKERGEFARRSPFLANSRTEVKIVGLFALLRDLSLFLDEVRRGAPLLAMGLLLLCQKHFSISAKSESRLVNSEKCCAIGRRSSVDACRSSLVRGVRFAIQCFNFALSVSCD